MTIVALHVGSGSNAAFRTSTQAREGLLRFPSGGLLSPANSGEGQGQRSALAARLGAILLTALAVHRRAGSEQCRP